MSATYKLVEEKAQAALSCLTPDDRAAVSAWVEDSAARRVKAVERWQLTQVRWVEAAVVGLILGTLAVLTLAMNSCVQGERDEALQSVHKLETDLGQCKTRASELERVCADTLLRQALEGSVEQAP